MKFRQVILLFVNVLLIKTTPKHYPKRIPISSSPRPIRGGPFSITLGTVMCALAASTAGRRGPLRPVELEHRIVGFEESQFPIPIARSPAQAVELCVPIVQSRR